MKNGSEKAAKFRLKIETFFMSCENAICAMQKWKKVEKYEIKLRKKIASEFWLVIKKEK